MNLLEKFENHLKKKEAAEKVRVQKQKQFKKKYSRSIKFVKKIWQKIK